MLGKPRVIGPVTELSSEVLIVGVIPGAQVHLVMVGANNAPVVVGDEKSASTSHTFVVKPNALQAGQWLWAEQRFGGETSETVKPRFTESISAAPSPSDGLPPPVFLGGIHECADWVLLDGLIIGATLELRLGKSLVGSQIVTRPAMPVRLTQYLSKGQTLEAIQMLSTSQGTLRSPSVRSLMIDPVPPSITYYNSKNSKLPSPTLQGPFGCDTALAIGEVIPGATVEVVFPESSLLFPFYGESFAGILNEPLPPGSTVAVRQKFENCKSDFADSDSVTKPIEKLTDLPEPHIYAPLCLRSSTAKIGGLRPGALVSIQYIVRRDDGQETASEPILYGAHERISEFELPEFGKGWWDGLSDPYARLILRVSQGMCGVQSKAGERQFETMQDKVAPPKIHIHTPIECSRQITVDVAPGSLVAVRTALPSYLPLSRETRVFTSPATIHLHRPLKAEETIEVVVEVCNGGMAGMDDAKAKVITRPPLDRPKVPEPIRLPLGGVLVQSVLPGAHVSILVNGTHYTSVDAEDTSIFVPVRGLKVGDEITAVQQLCGYSEPSWPPVRVTLGGMAVSHTPAAITKGEAQAITISAEDVDDGRAVLGVVKIGGVVVGQTGTPFTWTFPVGQPAPSTTVQANGYQEQNLTWHLVEPVKQTAMLSLNVANPDQNLTVHKVTWTLVKYNALNPAASTPVSSQDGSQVQIALNKPKGGMEIYAVQCEAHVEYKGRYPFKTWIRGTDPNDVKGWHQIGWAGNDLGANFIVKVDPVYDRNFQIVDVTASIHYTGQS